MSQDTLARADFWLERGFYVLPCQPNKKALVGGFGQYRAKITSHVDAVKFWGNGGACNMAVLSPEGFYILDFDIPEVYKKWAQACPEAAQTYSEATPRSGTHVFLQGTPPAGLTLIKGAEIKRVVLVAPSSIEGKPYETTFEGEILQFDPVQVFSPLSAPGHATPYALQASAIRQARSIANPLSRIEQIKAHFIISNVLTTYRPDIKFFGRGDFKSCHCPFHKDNKPSFWLNDAAGLWGCHGCNVRGDVINLYARFEMINVREAISRMWAVMA